jgi:hypothetical protein
MRINLPVINVYERNTIKSKVSTQLLYGDNFKKLRNFDNWIKIKNETDGYIGFIKKNNFSQKYKNTHKVYSLYANIYLKPSIEYMHKNKLSFGSKLKIIKKNGAFYNFDRFWIKKKDVKKINFKTKNIFYGIRKFVNVKYKWGGKCFDGVDCSGLVQLFFNFNNKFCPRDTKEQMKYFKRKVEIKNIKKDDLIFWKGHVALAISKSHLIHAYGPLKKTVIMPIKNTINRIHKTANLKVIGIRRSKK